MARQRHGGGVTCLNPAAGLVFPQPFEPPRRAPGRDFPSFAKEGSFIAEFHPALKGRSTLKRRPAAPKAVSRHWMEMLSQT